MELPTLNKDSAIDNHLTTSRKTEQERTDEINLLIDYIREHQPISMWALAKVMGIPNTTLYYKIRDLEFAGVIYSKIIINEYNRAVRMIYCNKKGEKNVNA